MKLVIIIAGLNVGGAEMMLLKILERLGKSYTPYVISLTSVGEIGLRIRRLGIPVESFGLRVGAPNPVTFFRLMHRLKQLKPDLVHTWMYHSDLFGGIAAHCAGVPAIGWAIRAGNLPTEKTKWMTRLVVRACANLSHRLPDRIISCSNTARDIHIALGYDASRFIIIPNGFDLSRFHPDSAAYAGVREELGIPADAPIIGLVGRFDLQKNHQGFFHAAGILHAKRPDAHFVLCGKGIDMSNSRIASWVRTAGISKATHLLGLRDDIPRLTAAFDIAASASSWGEAFPNVLGEAMACGVPSVVTDVGDSAFIVGDTGRVVPPGDMAGLAGAINDLLSVPEQSLRDLGARARKRVAEYFEIGHVVKCYESFYEELAEIGRNKNKRFHRANP